MEQFKRAKVIMLPTENKSNIGIVYRDVEKTKGKLVLNLKVNDNYKSYINLFIISDDEIKEGDWFYCPRDKYISNSNLKRNLLCKKIISTTDSSLVHPNCCITKEGLIKANEGCRKRNRCLLPQPSEQFIEKYIESYNKGEVITDVLVEYDYCLNRTTKGDLSKCPKVNPKDNTITIKKVKDSWNREEVIELMKKYCIDIHRYTINSTDFNKWIEENL